MACSKQSKSVTDEEKKNFKDFLSSFLIDIEKVKNSRFRIRMRLVCEIVMEHSDLISKPKGSMVIVSAFSRYIHFLGEWIELVINLFNLKNEERRTGINKKWITAEKHLAVRSNMFFIYTQLEDFLSKVSNTVGKVAFLVCKDELDPFIGLLKRKCIGPSYHFPDGFPHALLNDSDEQPDSFAFFNKKRKLTEENLQCCLEQIENSNESNWTESEESNENVKQFEIGFSSDSEKENSKSSAEINDIMNNELYSLASLSSSLSDENSLNVNSLIKPRKRQNCGENVSPGKNPSPDSDQDNFKLPHQVNLSSYSTFKKPFIEDPQASSTPKKLEKIAKRQQKSELPQLSTINEESSNYNSNYNSNLTSLRPESMSVNLTLGKISMRSPQSTASPESMSVNETTGNLSMRKPLLTTSPESMGINKIPGNISIRSLRSTINSPTLYYDSQASGSIVNKLYDEDEESVYSDFDSDDMEPPMPKFKKFNFKKKPSL